MSATTLASDIQQAIQHAVGEANNPALRDHGKRGKTNKKKNHTDTIQHPPDAGVAPGDLTVKKKKRKHNPTTDDAVERAKKQKSIDHPESSYTHDNITLQPHDFVSSAAHQQPEWMNYHSPYDVPVYAAPPSALHQQPLNMDQGLVSNMFDNSDTLSLDTLSAASNDDILRALQDLDLSKVANLLKQLGDAASAANSSVVPEGNVIDPPLPKKVASGGEKKGTHRRTLDMSLPDPTVTPYSNPNHAELLATKWMSPQKLAEMVRTEGLVYKKGKFSAIEEQQVKEAVERYRVTRGLTEEQLMELIYAKHEKGSESSFWSEITSALSQRPIIAVYHYIRRAYHPYKQMGKWSQEEDDCLRAAITELGQQWEKVGARVGRMPSDCRDRYRNHIAHREERISGPWTIEEEIELTKIVTEMTIQQGRDPENEVFWGIVAERMGNRRNRQQCRIKWIDGLSKTIKNEGKKPRWNQQDAYILVHKIDSLNVRDDTEIDWKRLGDPAWNLWSAHCLQRRWLSLKRSIKGYEDMTHSEIMDILRMKKATLPPAAPYTRSKRHPKVYPSAEMIPESELADEFAEELEKELNNNLEVDSDEDEGE